MAMFFIRVPGNRISLQLIMGGEVKTFAGNIDGWRINEVMQYFVTGKLVTFFVFLREVKVDRRCGELTVIKKECVGDRKH